MNIIDVIIIIIIVLIAVINANKGFLKSIFNILGLFLSWILSKMFSPLFADYIYNSYFNKRIISELYEIMPSGSIEGEIGNLLNNFLDSLPGFISSIAKQFNLYPNIDNMTQSGEYTVDMIEGTYIAPMVLGVLNVVIFVILFIIFAVILMFILRLLNKILTSKKLKLFRKTNMFLGAALGVVKAVIPAGLICLLLNVLAPLLKNDSFTNLITGSYFCTLITNLFN